MGGAEGRREEYLSPGCKHITLSPEQHSTQNVYLAACGCVHSDTIGREEGGTEGGT